VEPLQKKVSILLDIRLPAEVEEHTAIVFATTDKRFDQEKDTGLTDFLMGANMSDMSQEDEVYLKTFLA
jgi:hypothetical protein